MKYVFNYWLRLVVKLALHLFYHKIKVVGKENIPKNKAVLVVSNHQNALIDPLMIATHTKLNPHFLTRASAFKNSVAAKMLDFIRMIPIYRVRDGIGNMEKNQETFRRSTQVLLDKGAMVVFAEGSHSQRRNIRLLKKGFARIAYQALKNDQELEIVILPVGLNYSNHQKSGSKVSIIFGPTLDPKKYYPDFDPLIKAVQIALQPLVVQLPEESYEEDLERLISKKIDLTDPAKVIAFLEKQPIEKNPKPNNPPYFTNKVMKVFHFPLHWIWLGNSGKIKDDAFIATWKFIIGLVGIPLWYLFLIFGLPFFGLGSWSFSWAFLGIVYLIANRAGQA